MTMLRLNREQRNVLADKVPDVVNIVMGAMAVALFLGDVTASPLTFVSAFTLWAAALVFAVWILKRGT